MSDFRTNDEHPELVPILRQLSQRAKRPLSWKLLVDRWEQLGREIENGYSHSIYDYVNDVEVRDLIDECIQAVPTKLRSILEAEMAQRDELFLRSTIKMGLEELRRFGFRADSAWARIPRTLVGDLKDDISALGI